MHYESIACPACKQSLTGKIGNRHYYCWNCLLEFQFEGDNEIRLYFVDEDGSLVELE